MAENIKLPSSILEPMMMAYALNDVSFFLKIKQYLDTNNRKGNRYFNDEKYQKIFNLLSRFFDKYKSFPKKDTFKALIDKFENDKEIKLYENAIIDKIYDYDLKSIDPIYLQEE